MTALRCSVVIGSYRRPDQLAKCLDGLVDQTLPPDEIVVVFRDDDDETRSLVASRAELTGVEVSQPGASVAMAAGAKAASGDVIAFVDDDAVPRPDWIARLQEQFAGDPSIGAVGGRDYVHSPHPEAETPDVGRIGSWGRLTGNHHVGIGPARDVEVLKGVNMTYRREALALPVGVRGQPTQLHYEVAMTLWARSRGWRVVYDPAIAVDHYPGPRFGGDQRSRSSARVTADASFNLVSCILAGLPRLALRRALYGLTVGDRSSPGLVRAAVGALHRDWDVVRALGPSLVGQAQALAAYAAGGGVRLESLEPSAPPRDGRPQITVVAHDVHPQGGMERALFEVLRRISADADVTVVASRLDPRLRPLVRWDRVTVPGRPFALKFVLFFIRAGLAVRRRRGDIVHVTGALIPNRADLSTVHFCHAAFTGVRHRRGVLRTVNSRISRALSLTAERWVYRHERVRLLAAVSEGVAAELHSHYPDLPVSITPNGVDLDRFRPDAEARAGTRRELEAGDECVALFVGGDWDRKGLSIALEAVALAGRESPTPVALWVVGRGDARAAGRRADELGLAGRVRFLGERSDVERFYAAADVLLLPSSYETFSLAAHEAAASGLPVVAPPVTGVAELIAAGGGIAVERDPAAVAAALTTLAARSDLRAQVGERGRAYATQFGWDSAAAAVQACYAQLLAGENALEAVS